MEPWASGGTSRGSGLTSTPNGEDSVCEAVPEMGKYFFSETDIRSSWEQVLTAFWQRYPNPYRPIGCLGGRSESSPATYHAVFTS
ncbi:hypothetical protein HF521_006474 [Silurus meridionalis]|uniref:PRELI/MSF1 domain-containing protein n=1 Tax=Silurus meridionalis TaxID=175797 RepID=A0A8T0ATB6_SILME|nr:hypothetical protein HF521_006474 [Silurus meridionalis]